MDNFQILVQRWIDKREQFARALEQFLLDMPFDRAMYWEADLMRFLFHWRSRGVKLAFTHDDKLRKLVRDIRRELTPFILDPEFAWQYLKETQGDTPHDDGPDSIQVAQVAEAAHEPQAPAAPVPPQTGTATPPAAPGSVSTPPPPSDGPSLTRGAATTPAKWTPQPFDLNIRVETAGMPPNFNMGEVESELQDRFASAGLFFIKVHLTAATGNRNDGGYLYPPDDPLHAYPSTGYNHYVYWKMGANPNVGFPAMTRQSLWGRTGVSSIRADVVQHQVRELAKQQNLGGIPYNTLYTNILLHEAVYQGLLGHIDPILFRSSYEGTITDPTPPAFTPTEISPNEADDIRNQTGRQPPSGLPPYTPMHS